MQQESLAAQVAQMRAAAKTLPNAAPPVGATAVASVCHKVIIMSQALFKHAVYIGICCIRDATAYLMPVPLHHASIERMVNWRLRLLSMLLLCGAVAQNSQSQKAAALAAAAALSKRLGLAAGGGGGRRSPSPPRGRRRRSASPRERRFRLGRTDNRAREAERAAERETVRRLCCGSSVCSYPTFAAILRSCRSVQTSCRTRQPAVLAARLSYPAIGAYNEGTASADSLLHCLQEQRAQQEAVRRARSSRRSRSRSAGRDGKSRDRDRDGDGRSREGRDRDRDRDRERDERRAGGERHRSHGKDSERKDRDRDRDRDRDSGRNRDRDRDRDRNRDRDRDRGERDRESEKGRRRDDSRERRRGRERAGERRTDDQGGGERITKGERGDGNPPVAVEVSTTWSLWMGLKSIIN